ncbi:tandem-95 repeat protein [Microbacterium esteraromaticum]|uniref:Tandem-95 repeat protein n=1 Tax=Microbacterium esteraromaticum TaxID=57043 RepID=A0A7D7WFR6_9MICO|nr:tandem-95 repeat protein [Microbacterium esteraromaticum]
MAIGAVALATMAVAYDGLPTTKVDLNDAGVWLTKSSSFLVGHFNHESTVLDGGLRAASEDYDVLQDGGTVVVADAGSGTVTAVDPARMALGDSASVPGSAKVALGSRTVAILDDKSGDLWVTSAKGLAGFDIKGADPTVELGKGADVTVGRDGTVFALAGEKGEVVTVPVDPEGLPLEASVASVGELDLSESPSITAVGSRPVVLDAAAGVVSSPGGFRAEIGGGAADAVLQQASAESSVVAVATPGALVQVPFDGGDPVEVAADGAGVAAAPVQLRGCTYAAWAGSATFVRDCVGESSDVKERIPGAEDAGSLTFRVNRDVIVLNDIIGGAAWLANESLQRVDDWSVLVPPEGESEDDENTTQETVETSLPERKEENTVPTAEDDALGVRPGGTTLLPVLDNDNDPDGDVLVASVEGKQPSVGEVRPILNGAALQITVPEDATGSASFTYLIDDGRGGKDTATVSLSVHDEKTNAAPRLKRSSKLAVEAGGTVSYNLLPDWIDPDGDDLYLRSVVPAAGDEVEFTTDGKITYRAVASLQGRKEVDVLVSDSMGKVADGKLILDVKPEGSTNPLTNADHVVTRAGEAVTVSPLANDTSAGREQLRLARVEDTAGAELDRDYANRKFSFKAASPGTYYVQYLATAGPKPAKGIVRVDVLDEQQSELPPVAVRDVAMLPAGSESLVGVLGNDSDPAGGVLVVQSVSVPPSSGVNVSVLNHETLRISDQGALSEPVRITYRISNGTKSAEGDVVVIPIPAPTKLLAPVTNDDEAVVRVGDVVTIPVLDNDVHPNGDKLEVAPDLVEPLVDPEDGEAFVSQDAVRFRAGDTPGTVYITYEAVDSRGQKAGGHVSVQVLPIEEDGTNAAPRPRDLTARALAGSRINIPVPLDGLDADGDSIELIGVDSAPAKGRIVEQGNNYLTYEAYADASGVDAFSYKVRDRLGAESRATIRVGVAPPEAINQAPYAVNDSVVVRPGRSVAVPALGNDSDPEGDRIGYLKSGLTLPPDVQGLSAKVSGDRLVIDVPDEELETSIQYTIEDAKGARATAAIFVKVDEDVPLMNPVARDDRVQVEDVKDDLTVDLDILRNDEDPDGTIEGVDVTVEEGARLLGDGKVRVTVGEQRQLIRYVVTDQDELSSSAFIFVPAIKELRPRLRSTKPLEVQSGETREIPLEKFVVVAGGGDVRLTEAAKVSASFANGESLIKDTTTLVYTSKDRFFGEDALTFEVTDGDGPDDPEGRKSTLTIPITVLPPDNQPPTLTGAQMQIAPGEKATALDLSGLATDPDPKDQDKLRFSVDSQPGEGIDVRIDGATLYAETGPDTPKGTAVTVGITVTDGTTEPVEGSVQVLVTASTRSLAVASPDSVDEADQGKTITVPALQNDINPFAAEGQPLKLLTAEIESGQGQAKVAGDGVEITPDKNFVGAMVVRYRIQDATKDPDREVEGRISVTVQGIPDAPGRPTVTAVEDRTVVLNWSAPSNNGAEITEYKVTSVSGNPYSKSCSSTTCTLDGLTNNVEYTFQVTATNRVGEGPASPASEMARPDTRPDTPLPPKLVFGDKALDVTWTTPTSSGSPVETYTLEISPTPPSGISQKTGVTGNSLRWEGLENGTDYAVRVQAHNRAPDPSSWSQYSATEIPAGIPGVVPAPQVNSAPSVGSEAQMTVSWDAAFPNGDAIRRYELITYRGSAEVARVFTGTSTSQTVKVPTSTTDYTYAVRAENKAGWNAIGAKSTPRRAFGQPGAPSSVTAEPLDRAIRATFTMTEQARNGASDGEMRYQYQLNAQAWQNWDGRSLIPANNGDQYTVRVRAYSIVAGQQSNPGNSTASSPVVPYGAPHAPTGSATNAGQSVTLKWNAEGSYNGRPITAYISIDGGAWQQVPLRGERSKGNGYDQTHSIRVKAVASQGGEALSPTYSARTDPRPQPTAQTVKGTPGYWPSGWGGEGSCTTSSCAYMAVKVANFPAGNYRLFCNDGVGSRQRFGGSSKYVPANGTVNLGCFYGNPGQKVWVTIEGWGDATSMNWY